MGLESIYINGQTPLDEEEKEDLKIKTISTRGELDEFEQANIEKAIEWTLKINPSYDKILSVAFIKEVHKRMFSEVWGWAGTFRKTNKNIGIDKYQIEIEITALMADCKFWIENKIFAEDEIAIRFADILISKGLKGKVFTWGSQNITEKGVTRSKYLNAIYEADKENIIPLLDFART